MGAGHDHATAGTNQTRLLIALAITTGILLVEVVGAAVTGSLALLVDAAHMLTDVVGLATALLASRLIGRPVSLRRTWGWQRAEVIAAGAQASLLLGVGAYAAYEGVHRLLDPPAVEPAGLALVGVIGLLGNLASMLVLAGSRGRDLNMRAAFLEVTNDALGSVAVLASAAVIAATGWVRADAVAGLVVAALILPRAILLLRESGAILLESTPEGLDLAAVQRHICEQPHVLGVHDLHASTVASGLPVLTAHVVLDDECFTDQHCLQILASLHECLATHHDVSVEHSTLQLESRAVADAHEGHLHARP